MLLAVDAGNTILVFALLDKGEIKWQIAHGETADNVRNNPALKGLNIPRTGRPGLIGPLVTKTLVIAGEGGLFTTPNGKRGAMTYMHNGRQYIVIAVSGGNYSAELIAFRLPQS